MIRKIIKNINLREYFSLWCFPLGNLNCNMAIASLVSFIQLSLNSRDGTDEARINEVGAMKFVKNCWLLNLGTLWTKTKKSAHGKYIIKKQLTLYHLRIGYYQV